MTQYNLEIGPMARSKYYTNAQIESLNIWYNGNNLTWKGYVHQLCVYLQRVYNASELARPGHPRNLPIKRVINLFILIHEFEMKQPRTTYVDLENKILGWMNKIGTDDECETITEAPNTALKNLGRKQHLIELHECIWDTFLFTLSPFFFDKVRFLDENLGTILKGPQTNRLDGRIDVLANLWRIIEVDHLDACKDLPELFHWGTEPFVVEWLRFRESLEATGYISTYPEKVNFVIILVAMATLKFKYTSKLIEVFKEFNYSNEKEADWRRFCFFIERALDKTDEKVVPLDNELVEVPPTTSVTE